MPGGGGWRSGGKAEKSKRQANDESKGAPWGRRRRRRRHLSLSLAHGELGGHFHPPFALGVEFICRVRNDNIGMGPRELEGAGEAAQKQREKARLSHSREGGPPPNIGRSSVSRARSSASNLTFLPRARKGCLSLTRTGRERRGGERREREREKEKNPFPVAVTLFFSFLFSRQRERRKKKKK